MVPGEKMSAPKLLKNPWELYTYFGTPRARPQMWTPIRRRIIAQSYTIGS